MANYELAIVVTGSRDAEPKHYPTVWREIANACCGDQDWPDKNIRLIYGDCRSGVDSFIPRILNSLNRIGVTVDGQQVKAEGAWPAAGPLRNKKMIEEAMIYSNTVVLVAFPCLLSQNKGTFGCCGLATARGIAPQITILK